MRKALVLAVALAALALVVPSLAQGAFRGQNGKIALVTQGKTRDEIAVVNADGTGFKTLAKSKKRSFLNPRWSPDR